MQKQIKNFSVFDCGLVVNPVYPHLGASPDAKVFNPLCQNPYGILEIKCPYASKGMKLESILNDPKFYLAFDNNNSYTLKKDHPSGYYSQVQGQMALTGLSWCDFCVFLSDSNEMVVTKIKFDENYWRCELLPKLNKVYFKFAILFLMSKN